MLSKQPTRISSLWILALATATISRSGRQARASPVALSRIFHLLFLGSSSLSCHNHCRRRVRISTVGDHITGSRHGATSSCILTRDPRSSIREQELNSRARRKRCRRVSRTDIVTERRNRRIGPWKNPNCSCLVREAREIPKVIMTMWRGRGKPDRLILFEFCAPTIGILQFLVFRLFKGGRERERERDCNL